MSREIENQAGHTSAAHVDAVVVGAGFGGLYSLYSLRAMGMQAQVYEAGGDVGGTWYFNRYPGARCDVESIEYSYSFSEELQQEWQWTERYASQPEILSYINHTADRFDLRKHIQFNTRVVAAEFNAAENHWMVRTDRGDVITATFCVMAAGCLSTARLPDIKGIDSFAGKRYHTGKWPAEGVDFSGQRVGVIGTGSSGIQVIPMVARQAEHLYVFQRTPHYSLPAGNRPLEPEQLKRVKMHYADLRKKARQCPSGIASYPIASQSAFDVPNEERQQIYTRHWGAGRTSIARAFTDLLTSKEANKTVTDFVDAKIRNTVRDPAVAAELVPKGLYLGTKRVCLDTQYYETYNRSNVTLVNIRRAPIEEINTRGIVTRDKEYALDAIVFATGFDAVTGALLNIDIRGEGGRSLKEKWSAGPRAYLGLMTAGFPNLFIITGPGSPSILTNMVLAVEQHVEFVADCLAHLRRNGLSRIDADPQAESEWVAHVGELADKTLYPLTDSWYVGANIPGKPRGFMAYVGGVGRYVQKCQEVVANHYQGFVMTR